MDYQELRAQVQQYINNSDPLSIIEMITAENVDTVARCDEKYTYVPAPQQLTNPPWMVAGYEELKADITAAATADAAIAQFTPGNMLFAQIGGEYEEALATATAFYTELGFASPSVEAEEQVKAKYERLKINSNQLTSPC